MALGHTLISVDLLTPLLNMYPRVRRNNCSGHHHGRRNNKANKFNVSWQSFGNPPDHCGIARLGSLTGFLVDLGDRNLISTPERTSYHEGPSGLDIRLVDAVARGASRFENLLTPQKTYWPPKN